MIPNCNRCDRQCPYSYKFKLNNGKIIKRRGIKGDERKQCEMYRPPKEGWRLAELALTHPQSLHDCLSRLPFKVNVSMYL